ncbi:Rv3654c family TadE-like protein [Paenarthrobacter sp. RAF54_2]|uniref:Rv3654c family TadE-like protein n=1 Tax=unclassified Paenarthrobacter TaxID=2634190 RepID=UPI003F9D47A0
MDSLVRVRCLWRRTLKGLPVASHPELGSGTVLALSLGFAVLALLGGLLLLAQAGVMASRAASAADLAALAAADAARGIASGEPCAVAASVAGQQGATLTACDVVGGDVVELATELEQPFLFGTATGRARAGPPP